jgi:putative peptidoglycan lipid II flippase
LGLPAQVLVKALSPAFFAREDTTTPLLATLVGLVIAIIFALVLNRPFGTSGIAAAIALAAWGSAIFLIVRSAAAFGFSPDHDARRRLPIIVLSSLAMGGLLWLAAHIALPWTAQAHGLVRASLLGLLIVGGLAIYAALLTLSGAVRWAEVRGALKRSPAAG